MKVRIINKMIVADNTYIELIIIKIFDNENDISPYVIVHQVDKLSDRVTDSVYEAVKDWKKLGADVEFVVEDLPRNAREAQELEEI